MARRRLEKYDFIVTLVASSGRGARRRASVLQQIFVQLRERQFTVYH